MKLQDLAGWLKRLKDKVVGWDTHDKVLVEISLLMALTTQRCFALAQSPAGVPWAPRRYPDRPRPHRPLILTATMLNSVLTAMKVPKIENHKLIFTIPSSPAYTIYHQFGTRRMPARPFVGWGKDSLAAAKNVAAHKYVEIIYQTMRRL